MRLKRLISVLGALGLIWIVQLALFVVLFAVTLFVVRQLVDLAGARHVPILALCCLLTFILLGGVQAAARRYGWIERSASFRSDLD